MSKVIVDEIQTDTSNGNVRIIPNGTGKLEVKGAGGDDAMLQLNCSAQSHGVKIKSPNHSAGQSYTMILPDNNIEAGKFLKVDSITGSGNDAVGQLKYADVAAGVTVQEEGSSLSTAGTTLNFVGAGVTASGTGATKTITVPGGGGSLEYVSKSTVSSDNSVTQIDFTGLDTNAVYKIIAKKIKYSTASSGLRMFWLDSSGNTQNYIHYQRSKGASSSWSVEYNQSHIEIDPQGDTDYMAFVATLHTPAIFNWMHLDAFAPQEDNKRCQIFATFGSSGSSQTINGVRLGIYHGNQPTVYFQSGTEIVLYKYKES